MEYYGILLYYGIFMEYYGILYDGIYSYIVVYLWNIMVFPSILVCFLNSSLLLKGSE